MSDTKSGGEAGKNVFMALLSETAQQLEDNHMVDDIESQTTYDLERPLVWIDLEMTGLDPDCHTIIEIAVIVTDGELKKEIEGPNLVIHHQQDVLDNMNDWSREQHGKSGLLQRVKESTLSMAEAQRRVLAFVQEHVAKGAAPLAGNSVYMDRLFLRKYMPDVDGYLHFRLVDVSTINELGKRWFFRAMRKLPAKTKTHTALADVRESLEELRWYRNHIFDVSKAHGESSARRRR